MPTSLHIAAQNGHLTVVEALLHEGADFNQASANGETPLYTAAQNGHLTVVEALLHEGADSNQANANGITPLYTAAQNGHLTAVEALLHEGAAVNQADVNGITPLHIAARHGHLTVVEALLHARADSNQASADGVTPLYIAACHGHSTVVQVLLSDEAVRDYYLNQLIINPGLMRNAFTQNPAFFTALSAQRKALWARLRDPAHFHLSPDEYRGLLIAILDSRQELNEALRHPLYTLFNTRQLQGRGLLGFFDITNTILDDIQNYIDIKRFHLNLPAIKKRQKPSNDHVDEGDEDKHRDKRSNQG